MSRLPASLTGTFGAVAALAAVLALALAVPSSAAPSTVTVPPASEHLRCGVFPADASFFFDPAPGPNWTEQAWGTDRPNRIFCSGKYNGKSVDAGRPGTLTESGVNAGNCHQGTGESQLSTISGLIDTTGHTMADITFTHTYSYDYGSNDLKGKTNDGSHEVLGGFQLLTATFPLGATPCPPSPGRVSGLPTSHVFNLFTD